MTKTKKTQTLKTLSPSKLDAIGKLLCDNSDELINRLGLSLRKDPRKYSGSCPVHDGDNIGALNLFYEGHTMPGFWKCYTRGCQKIFQPTIIGFVRGVLSQQKGWKSEEDPKVSFEATIDWCLDFLQMDIDKIYVDQSLAEKKKFISIAETLYNQDVKLPRNKWTKEEFLTRIDKDNDYFVQRKFSKEVLNKFDVGLSKTLDTNSLAFNRVLVPIYDETGKFVVGAQGRSIYKQCNLCKLYHSNKDLCPRIIKNSVKWVNIPEKFEISQHFYNIWSAKKYIKQTKSVILVEGPPNVWRLDEAGYYNTLALCGSNLSDAQQITLEMLGIHTIYSLPDNDQAGKEWSHKLYERLKRQFKIVNIELPLEYNDIAEAPVDTVKNIMKGVICS